MEESHELTRSICLGFMQDKVTNCIWTIIVFASIHKHRWAYTKNTVKHVYSETILCLYSVFLEFEISTKYLETAWTNQEAILSHDKSLHGSKLRVLWDVYFILEDKLCKIKIWCFNPSIPSSFLPSITPCYQVLCKRPGVGFSIPAGFEHLSF